MRRVRIFALGIVSFFAVLIGALLAPGTFVNRALSAALCTVFSFNSTICTVNLVNSSDRVVAATPPAVERNISDWLGQRNREFDDEPNTPPANNPQVPPFPQDPGPNQPVRPDFDNPGSSATTNRQNTPTSVGKFTITRHLQEVSPNTYEMVLKNPEGCQITRIIKRMGNKAAYDSIEYETPNANVCGGASWSLKFKTDGKTFTAKNSKNETFTVEISDSFARIEYLDKNGQKKSSYIFIGGESNFSSKLPVKVTNLPQLNFQSKAPQLGGEKNIFLNVVFVANDPGDIANDLYSGICGLFAPMYNNPTANAFDLASNTDTMINTSVSVGTAAAQGNVGEAQGSLVQAPIEAKILGFFLDRLRDMTNSEVCPAPPPAASTCNCVFLAKVAIYPIAGQYTGSVEGRGVYSEYFGAPCNANDQEIKAKISRDLVKYPAALREGWKAELTGMPEPVSKPQCSRRSPTASQPQQTAQQPQQTPQQQLRACRVTGVEKYNNMTMNRGGCAIQGPVMTEDGPVDGKTQCGICNTFIGGLAPRAGSCQEGVETDPRIAFLGLNKPILCPPNWDSGY